jgi:hypothetical protein
MAWIVRDIPPDGILKAAERRDAAVSETVWRITTRLREENIDYAIVGGIAMAAHGYWRFTNDVDVLIAPDDLSRVYERLVGRGYSLGNSEGAVHDIQTGVEVEFISAALHPKNVAIQRDGISIVSLPKLLELKLASGLSAEHRRLRDLADVQDLIIALKLPRALGDEIDPSVRDEFYRMWDAAQE